MSAITIPGRRRSHPKHRASDEVRELRNWKTQANAYFRTLSQDLTDMYEAWQKALTRANNATDFIALQDTQLRCANGRVAELEAELAAQTAELNQLRAFKATIQAVTPMPAVRDTSDMADQATAPIDVRTIRERFAAGPVLHLNHSPHAVPAA